MSKWIVDIHGDIEGDYKIIKEYEEPKTGHWIDNKARKDLCNCSECGALSKAYSRYCPNCGAKMKGVNNLLVPWDK